MRWQGYRREDESWCPPGPKDKWLQYSAYLAFVLWQPFVFRSRRRPTIRILTEPPRPHILFFRENVTFQSDGVPALIPIPGFPHYSGGCDHRLRWKGAGGGARGTGRGTSVPAQRWTFDSGWAARHVGSYAAQGRRGRVRASVAPTTRRFHSSGP